MSRILIALLLLVNGCATGPDSYTVSRDLTDEQVNELLDGVNILYVSQLQLEGFSLRTGLADWVMYNPTRVYILETLSPENRQKARRHAASHIYDVEVLGLTIEESARHAGW